MSEIPKPFVVNDRRKFTMEGELRPNSETSTDDSNTPVQEPPERAGSVPPTTPIPEQKGEPGEKPPADLQSALRAPTSDQTEQSRIAYEATVERLDTAIRSANPGVDHPPAMTFEQLVQSVYMTSIMQLGGATPEDQQPQIDLMGARQSIDMLSVLSDKTSGNLSNQEKQLLESALFDARLAFLEVTQALARSAANANSLPKRPSIVR